MCTNYTGIGTPPSGPDRSTMASAPTATPLAPRRGGTTNVFRRCDTTLLQLQRHLRVRLRRRHRQLFPRMMPSPLSTRLLHPSSRTGPSLASPSPPKPDVLPQRSSRGLGRRPIVDPTRGLGRLHRTTSACQRLAASDALHGLGVPFGVHTGSVNVFVSRAGVPILPAGFPRGSITDGAMTPYSHVTNAHCPTAPSRKGSTFQRALAVSVELHQQDKQQHQSNSKYFFESPPQQQEDSRPPPSPNWSHVVAPEGLQQATTLHNQNNNKNNHHATIVLSEIR